MAYSSHWDWVGLAHRSRVLLCRCHPLHHETIAYRQVKFQNCGRAVRMELSKLVESNPLRDLRDREGVLAAQEFRTDPCRPGLYGCSARRPEDSCASISSLRPLPSPTWRPLNGLSSTRSTYRYFALVQITVCVGVPKIISLLRECTKYIERMCDSSIRRCGGREGFGRATASELGWACAD